MATQQQILVLTTCDMCPPDAEPIEEDHYYTARLALGLDEETPPTVELDLCPTHFTELTTALDGMRPFIELGRKVHPAAARRQRVAVPVRPAMAERRTTTERRNDIAAVREWARSNGYPLGDRGRIPASIMEAFAAAGQPA